MFVRAHEKHWFRRASALALLAWLGLVLMGMAQAMPVPTHDTLSLQASTLSTTTGHTHASHTCGAQFGCHCGGLCYGGTVPDSRALAHASMHGNEYAPLAPSVPVRLHPPLLHPPSA
ncbi:hypothetical protein GCM10027285_23350 [Oleiagrimonas citrea]|nr:hypothetical protein BTJ49_14940 [Oleiagrimonas sp. MCCC 1A03011]